MSEEKRTGGMVDLVSTCKKCNGKPKLRKFELPDYKGECCVHDDCMLAVRWEEKEKKVEQNNTEENE